MACLETRAQFDGLVALSVADYRRSILVPHALGEVNRHRM
jgi:hypothetical protein